MTRLFHYTYGHKLQPILHTGGLLPSNAGARKTEIQGGQFFEQRMENSEKRVLWLSSDTLFEPTAVKDSVNNDQLIPGNWKKDAVNVGLYRFELVDPQGHEVLRWPEIAKAANIVTTQQRKMVAAGQKKGALPSNWHGIILESGPLPLERLKIQELVVLSNDKQSGFKAQWSNTTIEKALESFKSKRIQVASL